LELGQQQLQPLKFFKRPLFKGSYQDLFSLDLLINIFNSACNALAAGLAGIQGLQTQINNRR